MTIMRASIHMSVRIISPAYRRAVLAQTAGMPSANADCRESLIGGRRRLAFLISAPTRRRAVFTQPTGMPAAALDYRELILSGRRRFNCPPAYDLPIIPQGAAIAAAYTDRLEIKYARRHCGGRGSKRYCRRKRRRRHRYPRYRRRWRNRRFVAASGNRHMQDNHDAQKRRQRRFAPRNVSHPNPSPYRSHTYRPLTSSASSAATAAASMPSSSPNMRRLCSPKRGAWRGAAPLRQSAPPSMPARVPPLAHSAAGRAFAD